MKNSNGGVSPCAVSPTTTGCDVRARLSTNSGMPSGGGRQAAERPYDSTSSTGAPVAARTTDSQPFFAAALVS